MTLIDGFVKLPLIYDFNRNINVMENKIVELDVRPILAGGVDPFEKIMEALNEINESDTLKIVNTFEPVPLINKLKSQGYTHKTERPDNGEVHTFITKVVGYEESSDTKTSDDKSDLSFEDLEARFKGKLNEIDVRDLEMPMPMVTILEEIEKLTDGEALYVHHKRLPQYLIPELENRDFKLAEKEVDENNLKLIIYKK